MRNLKMNLREQLAKSKFAEKIKRLQAIQHESLMGVFSMDERR